jgi:hypothetical protein
MFHVITDKELFQAEKYLFAEGKWYPFGRKTCFSGWQNTTQNETMYSIKI